MANNLSKTIVVLIVSESTGYLRGLAAVLRNLSEVGMVVDSRTPEGALEMASSYQPALALLDMDAAGARDRHLLSQLTSRAPRMRIAVLVQGFREIESARSAGADAVLVKGFRGQELEAVISRLLGLER